MSVATCFLDKHKYNNILTQRQFVDLFYCIYISFNLLNIYTFYFYYDDVYTRLCEKKN